MGIENPNQPASTPVPRPYTRSTSFTDWEANHPDEPVPGTSLDTEFNSLAVAIAAIIVRMGQVQKDDGSLQNGIVTEQSLDPELLDILTSGFNPRGAWATGVTYAVRDAVNQGGGVYVCIVQHTSGVDFNADLAAGYWMVWSPRMVASAVAVTPIPTLAGDNVQQVLESIADKLDALTTRLVALEAAP